MILRPVTVRRVDWFRVLADLQRVGFGLRAVASMTGVSKPVLIGLRNKDADPKAWAGEKLIALWVQATGQKQEDVPRWGDEYKPRATQPQRIWDHGQVCCPLCGTEHHLRQPKKDPPGPKPDEAPNNRQMALSL